MSADIDPLKPEALRLKRGPRPAHTYRGQFRNLTFSRRGSGNTTPEQRMMMFASPEAKTMFEFSFAWRQKHAAQRLKETDHKNLLRRLAIQKENERLAQLAMGGIPNG